MWLRVLIAGPMVVAAMMQHRPFWQQSAIMFLAFFGARLVELGVDTWRSTPARAQLALITGLGCAFGALAALVAPQFHHGSPPAPAARVIPPAKPPIAAPVHRPGTWKSVSINERQACAIRDDATLWCWGDVASFGATRTQEPRQVPGVANVTAVSVGFGSTCVLVDRHAWCFGSNYAGADGVPPPDSHDFRATPVRVPLADDLVAISAGTFHACALASSGEVWCWGANDMGQVGFMPKHPRSLLQATPVDPVPPTRVAIPPASSIAAGTDVTCAVGRDDGNVRCWGESLARNSMGNHDIEPPTVVPGLRAVTSIAAGSKQICVLAEEASPTCWGDDAFVDMSRPRPPEPQTLIPHDELHGALVLGLGARHACAVLGNGDARCWGANYQGQLGNGRREEYQHEQSAVLVVGIPKLVSVAAGEIETCGLTASGELWCWGHEEPRK